MSLKTVTLAVAMVVSAAILAVGVGKLRSERYVTVKGLAEREVKADLVIWPIGYKETADELGVLHERLQSKEKTIREFLKKSGFEESEIISTPPIITDNRSEMYDQRANAVRYRAEAMLTLRSAKVDEARAAMSKTNDLVKSGIALSRPDWEYKTEFMYTKLNEIKPSMIEEATKNAREGALKFAADSGSSLGSIRRATQGLFSIENLDRSTQHIKQVRVVTTVEYDLR